MTCSRTPSKSLAELGLQPSVLIPFGGRGSPRLVLGRPTQSGSGHFFRSVTEETEVFKLDWQVESFSSQHFIVKLNI